MAEFDINEYLRGRITPVVLPEIQPVSPPSINPITADSAPSELLSAAILRQHNQTQAASEQALAKLRQFDEQNKDSLIRKLDLSPDSIAGATINTLLDAGVTAQDLATKALLLPTRASVGISEDIGLISPESADRMRGGMKDFAELTSLRRFVDKTSANAFTEALNNPEASEAYKQLTVNPGFDVDTLKSAGTVVKNVLSTALSNPAESLQLIAAQTPNVAAAALTPLLSVASNAGYGAEYFDNWKLNFVNQNNRQPTPNEVGQAALKAIALAGSEQVSDLAMGKAVKPVKTALEASKQAAGTSVAEGFKKALLGASRAVEPLVKTAYTGAKTGLLEGATETYQTLLEGDLSGEVATPEDLYTAGAIGALSGGGITGTVAGLNELLQRVPSNVNIDDIKEAINTGVINKFVNPEKKPEANDYYSAAVALVGNTNAGNEISAVNLDRLDKEIYTPLSEMVNKLATQSQKLADGIKVREEKLNDPSITSDVKEQLNKELIAYKDTETKINTALTKFEGQLSAVQSLRNGLVKTAQQENTDEAVGKDLDAVLADTTKVDDAIANKLVIRSMASNFDASDDTATKLIKLAESSNLSDEVKQKLTTTGKAIQAANRLKNLKDVSKDVIEGTPERAGKKIPGVDMRGVKQYFDASISAFNNGFKTTAVDEFNKAVQFIKREVAKRDALSQMKVGDYLFEVDGKFVIQNNGKAPTNGKLKFNAAKQTQGRDKTVTQIDEDLTIAIPLLNGLALRLNTQPPFATPVNQNVSQATETKQTSQKGSQSNAASGAAAEVAGAKETKPAKLQVTQEEYDLAAKYAKSTNEADYDNIPGNIAAIVTAINAGDEIEIVKPTEGDANGLQKQGQEAAQEVSADELAKLAEQAGLVNDLINGDKENAAKSPANVQQQVETSKATKPNDTGKKQDSATGQKQETGSKSGDSGSSSKATGAEGIAENTDLIVKNLKDKIKRFEEFVACINK